MYKLDHWVFNQDSATLTSFIFQYRIEYQADLYTRSLSIQSRFSHSDYSYIPVLDRASAWSLHSVTEYSIKIRPLWSLLHFNTWYSIRLIYKLDHWVFNQHSATPIIAIFQYRIQYQADLCIQSPSIQSKFGPSDDSYIPVLDRESA
jgi:hypothetical protein